MECSSPSKTSQKRLPTRSSPGRSCPPRPRGDRRSPGLLFVYLAPMRLEGGLTNGFLEAKDPNWRSKWRLACADWYLGKHLWTPSSAWSFVLHNILCHTHIYNHTVYILSLFTLRFTLPPCHSISRVVRNKFAGQTAVWLTWLRYLDSPTDLPTRRVATQRHQNPWESFLFIYTQLPPRERP